jgi:hypothetical protein
MGTPLFLLLLLPPALPTPTTAPEWFYAGTGGDFGGWVWGAASSEQRAGRRLFWGVRSISLPTGRPSTSREAIARYALSTHCAACRSAAQWRYEIPRYEAGGGGSWKVRGSGRGFKRTPRLAPRATTRACSQSRHT